ncbi:hypothetical protein V6N13_021960 [Hibiscus sabdariffa]|uniref:Uncharacterized protein n=1 Tax=Hibiscus sabdariffa TaxID=183260 RepID=A0ABR2CQL1_9ROSI
MAELFATGRAAFDSSTAFSMGQQMVENRKTIAWIVSTAPAKSAMQIQQSGRSMLTRAYVLLLPQLSGTSSDSHDARSSLSRFRPARLLQYTDRAFQTTPIA